MMWGNDEQKRRYLPAACRGEKVLAFGLTEPEAGSNPLEMQTTYERRGDRYILNGVKYLISNGGIADAVVTFAYPAKPGDGKRRVRLRSLWIAAPGFVSEDLTAKMGMPSANTAMFALSDCAVPASNLLGAEGDGFRIAMGTPGVRPHQCGVGLSSWRDRGLSDGDDRLTRRTRASTAKRSPGISWCKNTLPPSRCTG